jgi:hypothetical protein
MKRCCFGSLAENHCGAPAVWRTKSGSTYCAAHKPTWETYPEWIGPKREDPSTSSFNVDHRLKKRAYRPPANPHWSIEHVHA